MSDNESHIAQIIRLIDGGDFTVLIGAGASREGWRNGQPLPLYTEVQRKYLEEFLPGVQADDEESLKEKFIDIINSLTADNTLIALSREYFAGTPGYAHAQFTAIASLLSKRKFFLRILTTNFDDLIESAAKHVFQDVHFFSVPGIPRDDEEQARHYSNVDRHVESGHLVVAHLFGDRSFTTPIFFPGNNLDNHFHRISIERIKGYLSKPLIVIGYSFIDPALASLVAESQAACNSVYIIDPSDIWKKRISTSRPIRHIKATFGEFTELLAGRCKVREEFKGRALERLMTRFPGDILFPNAETLAMRSGAASRMALQRAETRIGGAGTRTAGTMQAIVERPESGPKYRDFLDSPDKVQLIIGRSGSGKTTLLWQIYQSLRMDEGNICVYYDSASLDNSDSVNGLLAVDFYFSIQDRSKFFDHLERVMGESSRLLIFIDGVNEVKCRPLESIITDIYRSAQEWPRQVKVFVTCRDVYWDCEVDGVVKAQRESLFLGRADRLEHFSPGETESAYAAYAGQFDLRTAFSSLNEGVMEKMRYPLMLRMLAEAYQGQVIPNYVPAVKVFRQYRERLRDRFNGKAAFGFLIYLVENKVAQVLAAPPGVLIDDRLDPYEFGAATSDDVGKRFFSLADEGILQEIEDPTFASGRYYKFIYDRFFEFLVGEAWGREMRRRNAQRVQQLSEQISLFSAQSLMYQRAIIAELVNQNMSEGVPAYFDFLDHSFVQSLLQSDNAAVVDVTRQVLRELIHDAPGDFIEAVWGHDVSPEACEQILEIAGDALKTLPIHLHALSIDATGQNVDRLRDKAIRLAEHWCRDELGQIAFNTALIKWVGEQPALTAQIMRGLAFYSGLLLNTVRSHRLEAIAQLWRQILASRQDDPLATRALLGSVMVDLAKARGPRFFPSSTPRPPFGDYSSYPPAIRTKALQLMAMLTHVDRPLRDDDVDVIAFFGSELRDWNDLRSGNSEAPQMYYPFEYRIAQWVLLLQSLRDFDQAAAYLDVIANVGRIGTLDYALCAMKFALQQVHRGDREREQKGFQRMRSWVRLARDSFADELFSPLLAAAPLTRTDNLLSQTARIEAQLNPGAPIKFLVEYMRSTDIRECKLAVLSARHLWSAHPAEILLTFESLNLERDRDVQAWYLVTLAEMYGKYPKQVETYLDRVPHSTADRSAVRGAQITESIADLSYFGDDFYKEIFFDESRRMFLAKAYADIIVAEDFESWARDLTFNLIDRILGR
jgi:hypothetical protein